MIERNNIKFDDQLACDLNVEYLNTDIILYISDDLNASLEPLSEAYLDKIVTFVNSIDTWYPLALQAVKEWGVKIYGNGNGNIQLMSIHLLFEQNAPQSIFGLQFRPDYDVEHGAGIKMTGDDFKIIEAGSADIAFC
jgi:hypothetical protein